MAVLAGEAHAQTFRVVVVPGLRAHDLRQVAQRGAVGLLVPGAGPETNGGWALAMLERGVVRNSLLDPTPPGPARIRVEQAVAIPRGNHLIVVGLPRSGDQRNDRRYAVAVIGGGYRGVLTSGSTRIPGLVSVADIAPTALGEPDALGSEQRENPLDALADLERQIDDHNAWRSRTASWLEGATAVLAVVSPPAAVLGVAAALGANVVLGATDVTRGLAFAMLIAAALSGLVLARVFRSDLAMAAALTTVVLAYLVSFVFDERWVALSPLGPTQISRFYGITNLLATLLLVPSLAAAALLVRRPLAAAAVASLAFVTVAGSRFGADGGGALVLAVGFGVLGALVYGAGRRAVALAVAGGLALVGVLLALDALTGASSHVTRAVDDGPGELAADLSNRLVLSWERATASVSTGVLVWAGLAVFALLVLRLARLDAAMRERALPFAFAAAIGTSLIVNDSPKDVVLAGLAGFLALERLALGPRSAAGALRARLEGLTGQASPGASHSE